MCCIGAVLAANKAATITTSIKVSGSALPPITRLRRLVQAFWGLVLLLAVVLAGLGFAYLVQAL